MTVRTEMPAGPQEHIARHTGLVWQRDKVLHSDNIFSNRLADKIFLHRADRGGYEQQGLSDWMKTMGMIKFFWQYFRDLDHEIELIEAGWRR